MMMNDDDDDDDDDDEEEEEEEEEDDDDNNEWRGGTGYNESHGIDEVQRKVSKTFLCLFLLKRSPNKLKITANW